MTSDTAAYPMVVPPSGSWDGNDGPWSTFEIQVGTPPQTVRVLVSTVLPQTIIVSANKTEGGCLPYELPACPQSRGGLFNLNASSTWDDQGLYGIGFEENLQDYQDLHFAGDFGVDALGLGASASSGVRLNHQVLAAIATKDLYLGFLGVDPQPTNFSSFNNPNPSFLSSLKKSNNTPSLSYGYTAGAKYRSNQSFGSLTFGGYDTSRFVPSNISFQMAPDLSRDLTVNLNSIIFNAGSLKPKTLLSEKIVIFVDSTVPHIWLPHDSCTLFEDAFGITYDSTTERYLVNDTLHTQMQNQNANVSFVLSSSISNETVNIVLPYASFDLEIGPPFVDTTQRYFPLRRADNATQYTFGRTFLQESYLIADYEHSNFSISPVMWSKNSTNSVPPLAQIVAISSVNSTFSEPVAISPVNSTSSEPTSISIPHPGLKISRVAISGVTVSAVFVCIILASISFYIARKSRRRRGKSGLKTEADSESYHKPEMDGNGRVLGELEGLDEEVPELYSSPKMEMHRSVASLTALDRHRIEIEGSNVSAELEGDTLVTVDQSARAIETAELATSND